MKAGNSRTHPKGGPWPLPLPVNSRSRKSSEKGPRNLFLEFTKTPQHLLSGFHAGGMSVNLSPCLFLSSPPPRFEWLRYSVSADAWPWDLTSVHLVRALLMGLHEPAWMLGDRESLELAWRPRPALRQRGPQGVGACAAGELAAEDMSEARMERADRSAPETKLWQSERRDERLHWVLHSDEESVPSHVPQALMFESFGDDYKL